MHRRLLFLAAVSICIPVAADAQALSGVPLGAALRLSTVDRRLTNRHVYLIDVRADTLVLRDRMTRQPDRVLRASIERLDAFRPGPRRRTERANLIAGFSAIGGAVAAAAIPSSSRGGNVVYAGLGSAAAGWIVGFAMPNGHWERVIP